MTEAEAIKNINALNAVCGQKDFYNEEFVEALKMSVEALEKQIAKKPVKEGYFNKCPICSADFGTRYIEQSNYCPECGQKLDWSDV